MNSSVFISYRRKDAGFAAGHLYRELVGVFGREAVFKDVDSIPAGVDFREHIDRAISECSIVLAIISPQWAERLHDAQDFVRLEAESALNGKIPIIPLFLDDATMPPPDELPETIRALAFRNGLPLRSSRDLETDIRRILAAVKQRLDQLAKEASEATKAQEKLAEAQRAEEVQKAEETRKADEEREVIKAQVTLEARRAAEAQLKASVTQKKLQEQKSITPAKIKANHGTESALQNISGSIPDVKRRNPAPPPPRGIILASEIAAAHRDRRLLVFALVTVADAEAVLRRGVDGVVRAEAALRQRLSTAPAVRRVELFGDLLYGVFLNVEGPSVVAWAERLSSTGLPLLVGAVAATGAPDLVRSAATAALQSAYEREVVCVFVS